MSSLQVTLYEGLVGERNITCRDPGTTTGGQTVTIALLSESFYRSENMKVI